MDQTLVTLALFQNGQTMYFPNYDLRFMVFHFQNGQSVMSSEHHIIALKLWTRNLDYVTLIFIIDKAFSYSIMPVSYKKGLVQNTKWKLYLFHHYWVWRENHRSN